MSTELTQKLIGLCHDLGREERGMAILGERTLPRYPG